MGRTISQLCPQERCAVMGIVNVTEDSFSDGGRFLDYDAALAHARALVVAGADIIDVGGESTRPGATRVDPEVELHRVVPVIQQLAGEGVCTSVDTMRASVAEAAVAAGVDVINDVSAGLADKNMLSVMAASGRAVCLMHWQTNVFGNAAGALHRGGRVVADVRDYLARRIDAALAAGVSEDAISVDPGLGFGKTARDNWELLHHLSDLAPGWPILVGASRKRFLAAIRVDRGVRADADPATVAVSALAAAAGAWCVRVHDVAASRDAVDVVRRWTESEDPEPAASLAETTEASHG